MMRKIVYEKNIVLIKWIVVFKLTYLNIIWPFFFKKKVQQQYRVYLKLGLVHSCKNWNWFSRESFDLIELELVFEGFTKSDWIS